MDSRYLNQGLAVPIAVEGGEVADQVIVHILHVFFDTSFFSFS